MIHMVTGPGAMPDALSALQAGDILVCLDQAIHALPKGPWLTPVYVLAPRCHDTQSDSRRRPCARNECVCPRCCGAWSHAHLE